MKSNRFLVIIVMLLVFTTTVNAEESWQLAQPGIANIGQSVFVGRERLGLYVPKSFEGRKADENRTIFGIEIDNTFRFNHSNSEVKLKGLASKMKFDYKSDIIDFQIFRSKNAKPGASACMDCHGPSIPRTTAIIGFGKTTTDSYVYEGNRFPKAESRFFRAGADHWMRRNVMLRSEVRLGKVKQGTFSLDASSVSVGLGGSLLHRFTWSGDWVYSKVDKYKARNSLIGKLAYKISNGLKLKFEAGAFLDGYTQFGTNFSEMGLATVEPVKKHEDWLPNFFQKVRDKKFGYYDACIEYEYKF